ncbi:hypothetical protein QNN00_10085 [Bacillus velezensis]|nr:hypothetical protein [Bacillus velezensis]
MNFMFTIAKKDCGGIIGNSEQSINAEAKAEESETEEENPTS